MDKYELKELKVLLKIGILRGENSSSYKDIYNKVIEEIGENKEYPYIEKVMIEKGWMKRLDNNLYLDTDSFGCKHYSYEPYYILTTKGISELKKRVKEFKKTKIDWNIVVSVLGIIVTILLQRCVG